MSLNSNRQHSAFTISTAVRHVELKAEDDLQTHRQKLAKLIFDEMRQCAVLLDPGGTVLEANRAALACADAKIEDVRGILFWEAPCWQVSDKAVRQQWLACRRGARGVGVRYDVEISGSDEKDKIVIDYSLAPIRDNQGEVVFLLAEARDITERKAAEARLERKDAELQARLEHIEEIEVLSTHYEEILARLAESEAKFRVIADAMPQMVWSTRADGFHDYYNRQWYEFTGVNERETDGDKWNGMFHPEDQQRAWAAWQYSLRTGEPYEIEYRLRHRSGQYRWTLGRALPVRDDAGKIVRWMGTCTDIDDQKHMIEALRDSEERYRTLFNMMNEAFSLCEIIVDKCGQPVDYRHLVANPAFERVGNYSPGFVIGKTARELAPLVEEEWIALFGHAALTGTAVKREAYVAALDKYFEARAFGLGNGRFAYLLNDVTERKRIERERKETEDRLQLAVDIAHLGFWQWDTGSGYCYFSPQWKQQLGCQDDELENSTHEWRRRLHPEDRHRALDMI
jgi:PAS domain S-box-containing protein